MRRHQPCAAFTMIEVLAMLLVLSVGLTAVIGMLLMATRRSDETQMLQLATATAMTVAYDPTPLLEPAVAGAWTSAAIAMDDTTAPEQVALTRGYINGLYVVRREVAASADINAADSLIVYGRLTRVKVTVYSQASGSEITSYSCLRYLRRGTP